MSSTTGEMKKTLAIKPCQTMRGHTDLVRGVVHLPSGRRIITCSYDCSLRLWDLESGAQIGNDWRAEGDKAGVSTIALSPNGNTVASGSSDGMVRLWDVETGKVIVKWTGHSGLVWRVCWNANGDRVASGSNDGTIVTGGFNENAIKIWNAKTGELLSTVKHEHSIWSLAWTSNQKKLISRSSDGLVRIFDTDTWQQIALLEGDLVCGISLFQNNRLLATASKFDTTVRLWNLDTNLPVGPVLHHVADISRAAIDISPDGKLLVTCCEDNNAYVWDIHTILKDAGLDDLLSIPDKAAAATGQSLIGADATQRPAQLKQAHRTPQDFFDDARDGVHPSATRGTHPRSSTRRRRALIPSPLRPRTLLGRFTSFFRRFQHGTDGSPEIQQSNRQIVGPHAVEVGPVRDKQSLYVAGRPERRAKRIENPTWWIRCILLVCCVPRQQTDSHQ